MLTWCKCSSYNGCTMQGFSRLTPTQTGCALTGRPMCRLSSACSGAWPQHGHPLTAGAPGLPRTQGVSWSSTTSPSPVAPRGSWPPYLHHCQTLQSVSFSDTSNNKPKSKHIQNFFFIWLTTEMVANQTRNTNSPSRREVNKSPHPLPYQV